ncbi:MAG: preprotein translocase subunit SecG [Bacilli bacterium]|jgi:preprotein translocase subunit SecG|nr:preprotein translocase subunit SecG [Bacilli bacterium]
MIEFLEISLLVISIVLVAIVLLQSNKASDAGQIITGGNEALFGKMKERGLELFISRFTLILGLLFFVISFLLFVM